MALSASGKVRRLTARQVCKDAVHLLNLFILLFPLVSIPIDARLEYHTCHVAEVLSEPDDAHSSSGSPASVEWSCKATKTVPLRQIIKKIFRFVNDTHYCCPFVIRQAPITFLLSSVAHACIWPRRRRLPLDNRTLSHDNPDTGPRQELKTSLTSLDVGSFQATGLLLLCGGWLSHSRRDC